MSPPQSEDPAFEAGIRASFARQGLMATLGASIVRASPGMVEVALTPSPSISQQHGFVHAGAVSAIADTAAGYAALSLMPAEGSVLTVEFKVNLFAPARGDRLVARGRVLRSGRTITVCQGDAYGVTADGELHCATMVATMIRVDAPPAVADRQGG